MVGLALLGTVLVAPARASEGGQPRDTDLSAGQKADVRASTSIYKHAWSKKTRTLNYAKADKFDLGRARARRQFTRALIYTGARVTHLSKAERRKVMAYQPARRVSPAATFCEGDSRYTYVNPRGPRFIYRQWLNSCQTDALLQWMKGCATIAGILAGLSLAVPPALSITLATTVLCVLGGAVVEHYQNVSSLSAIWIKDDTHLLWAGAQ